MSIGPSGALSYLRASKGDLDRHWQEFNAALVASLGIDRQKLSIDVEYQADGAWAGLQGSLCERVQRNRGSSVFVVPIAKLPSDLVAWLGVREVWECQTGAKPYIFKELGLTVHFGFENDPVKPQVFRLEWPGVRDWTGAGPSFQASGAGHPHWQFDLTQSLSAFETEEVGPSFEEEDELEEFDAVVSEPSLRSLLQSLTIEKMHLASAAPWWLPTPSTGGVHHTNAPPDISSLTRWAAHGVSYLRQELRRCVVRPKR